MYPIETVRAIRHLDIQLFGAGGETPEPVFERTVHGNYEPHKTGLQPFPSNNSEYIQQNYNGFLVLNLDTGQLYILK